MEKVIFTVVGAVGIGLLLFFAILLSTIFGGIGGWIVGGVFPYVTDTLRSLLDLSLTNFELGAVLGFVGSFIKGSSSSSSK